MVLLELPRKLEGTLWLNPKKAEGLNLEPWS